MTETILNPDKLSPEFWVWETNHESVWGVEGNPFFVVRNGEMRFHARRELDDDVEIIRYTDRLERFGITTDKELEAWLDKGDEYFHSAMNPWFEVWSANDTEYYSEPMFNAQEAKEFAIKLFAEFPDGIPS